MVSIYRRSTGFKIQSEIDAVKITFKLGPNSYIFCEHRGHTADQSWFELEHFKWRNISHRLVGTKLYLYDEENFTDNKEDFFADLERTKLDLSKLENYEGHMTRMKMLGSDNLSQHLAQHMSRRVPDITGCSPYLSRYYIGVLELSCNKYRGSDTDNLSSGPTILNIAFLDSDGDQQEHHHVVELEHDDWCDSYPGPYRMITTSGSETLEKYPMLRYPGMLLSSTPQINYIIPESCYRDYVNTLRQQRIKNAYKLSSSLSRFAKWLASLTS